MTTRRDEIFEILCDYADSHVGNSPSLQDLCNEMKKRGYQISVGTIRTHMTKLIAEQRIERRDGKLIVIGADWLHPNEVSEVL
jgi:repressor of nif and glnA expression